MDTDQLSLFESTFASKARDEKEDDLISALPQDDSWPPTFFTRLKKYKGSWIPGALLSGAIAAQRSFQARPTDILVATPVKCGTVWLKALTFVTVTRKTYPLSRHPLLHTTPHECFYFVEAIAPFCQESEVDAAPPPRLLASHLPYSLLPDSVGASGCHIIYLCRDPKDSFVSLWHFLTGLNPEAPADSAALSKAFDQFCDGVSPYGPFWDHHLGYRNESLRRPERFLFLKYEEMMEDPAASLKRLAEFLGCPFSEEEERRGVVGEIVRMCSFEGLSGLEVNKTGERLDFKFASFFRKGKVGDWVNLLSPEMATKLDQVTKEKLCGSGLALAGDQLEAHATK